MNELLKLEKKIPKCKLCPRLVLFRESVIAKKKFEDQIYWKKPVPGFGDPNAWLLILGLAPAPHGGNRTGRIFTGDQSAKFLINALYETGFSNQPSSESKEDGLSLTGCFLTASVKCVPPKNKPLPIEIKRCTNCYLFKEIELLKNLKAVLALGSVAYQTYCAYAKSKKNPFKHGSKIDFEALPTLYGSYHPSPRNTNTGLLSKKAFIGILNKIRNDCNPM